MPPAPPTPIVDVEPLRVAVVCSRGDDGTLGADLRREGFRVSMVPWSATAIADLVAADPQFVVADVTLPGMAAIDAYRAIRAALSTPLVVVTDRDDETDVVLSLESGADDVVSRPYRPRELVARMRAVRRRTVVAAAAAAAAQPPAATPVVVETEVRATSAAARAGDSGGDIGRAAAVHAGDLRIDRRRHEVFLDGERVHLAPKEFELLWVLADRAGQLVPRAELIERVWGTDHVGGTKTLDVHVKRLRARVEDDASQPTRITTVRGMGFIYEPVVAAGERAPIRVVG